MGQVSKFWNFVDDPSSNEAELLLYGPIASQKPWWEDEGGDTATPKQFADDLRNLGNKSNITVRINSSGGDVWAANAIHALLKSNPARITAKIDGIAASAATIVAMAADEIQIPANGMMVIHDVMMNLCGSYNTTAMEKAMQELESIRNSIIAAYKGRTGKNDEELIAIMKNEAWLTGQEAVDMGFADIVTEDNPVNMVMQGSSLVVNNITCDLSKFKTRPPITNSVVQAQPAANKQKTKEDLNVEIKTVDDLRKAYPDFVNQIEQDAKTGVVAQERKRLQDIDQIANIIDPALLNKAKFEEPMDAAALAFQNAVLQSQKGTAYLQNAQQDSAASGASNVKPLPAEGENPEEAEKQVKQEKTVNSIVDAVNKLRG